LIVTPLATALIASERVYKA